MLILTGYEIDGKIEVLCSVCHRAVGAFSLEEIGAMSKALNAIYCFDCDAVLADTVHSSLYDESGRYFLRIEGQWFSINIWQEVKAQKTKIEYRNQKIQDIHEFLISLKGVSNYGPTESNT